MKRLLVLLMSTTIVLCSTIISFAGEWKQDNVGWWYQNDDGSYPSSTWKEIGGKQYYFNEIGYMLHDTTTPDGYKVGSDGAWIVDLNKSAEYQGAAIVIDMILNELLNPNSLYIKHIYYTDSNSDGKQEWYFICLVQNKGGEYSMFYHTMSVKDDGTLFHYVSSTATQTSDSLIENKYVTLDIDRCIATYNTLYNQNRNIVH